MSNLKKHIGECINVDQSSLNEISLESSQDEIINAIDYKKLYLECKNELQLYKNLYNQLLEMINSRKN